jgi:hypothetical protein
MMKVSSPVRRAPYVFLLNLVCCPASKQLTGDMPMLAWSCFLQEKQQAVLAEQEEQQRMDLMMEIERLRALEAYQVREAARCVPMWTSTWRAGVSYW